MNVDSISLFCWDFLSFNVAVVIKLDLDLFLTDFEVTIFNVESRRRRLDRDFCFYTVVFFTTQSDLIVLIITDETKKNEASSKAILTAKVWFLLSLSLSRSLSVSMKKNEAKNEESDDSVVSLFFIFCLFLCLNSALWCMHE